MPNSELVHEGYFQFDSSDPIFVDHFPGYPVVPGSLIINAFVTAIKSIIKDGAVYGIENFRFKRFITPGCYAYRVILQGGNQLTCTLYQDQHAVVTGCVLIVKPHLNRKFESVISERSTIG